MELLINESKKLSEIKKTFQKKFPYLKIEFFKIPHKVGEPSHKETMIEKDLKVGDIKKGGARGRINITGVMTVKELEQKFSKLFGVNIQVFRKSGNVWIQTTVTDNWTLTVQNDRAIELSNKIRPHDMNKNNTSE